MQGFLFLTMVLYRQITVLFLFFSILVLFIVPSQENYIFIILKGLVIGGLCIVFASYAFPNIYSNNGLFKSNKVKSDYEEKTFSSAIKVHYDRLIKHAEEIILAINNNYSVGIYMYDNANKGFSSDMYVKLEVNGEPVLDEISLKKDSTANIYNGVVTDINNYIQQSGGIYTDELGNEYAMKPIEWSDKEPEAFFVGWKERF